MKRSKRIKLCLDRLDPTLMSLRVENAYAFGLLAMSGRARRGERFTGREAELFFNNLVDQVAGMLAAPVSAETHAQLVSK